MGKKEKEKELSLTEQLCKSSSKKDCPDRVAQNGVGGLLVGLLGGAAYRVVVDLVARKGVERAATNTVARAPVAAVSCGIVMVVYTALECLAESLRKKRDSGNCFAAGAVTGALLGTFPLPQARKSTSCGCAPKVQVKTPLSRAMNGLIGAIAFGVVDGILRSEACEKKPSDDKNKKNKKK